MTDERKEAGGGRRRLQLVYVRERRDEGAKEREGK